MPYCSSSSPKCCVPILLLFFQSFSFCWRCCCCSLFAWFWVPLPNASRIAYLFFRMNSKLTLLLLPPTVCVCWDKKKCRTANFSAWLSCCCWLDSSCHCVDEVVLPTSFFFVCFFLSLNFRCFNSNDFYILISDNATRNEGTYALRKMETRKGCTHSLSPNGTRCRYCFCFFRCFSCC